MKKILNINIAGVIFNVEEDAYTKLDRYLSEIKEHFSSYPDRGEIISDIENRVAEQFLASSGPNKIVTDVQVDNLIAMIGKVEDFDKDEQGGAAANFRKSSSDEDLTGNKHLFRSTDDVVIGGVASGLAAYFNLDPLLVRILFAASVFLGGGGIIFYILLWIIMPPANTTADKLRMHSNPISELREKIKNYREGKSSLKEVKAEADKVVIDFSQKVQNSGIFSRLRRFIELLITRIFKLLGAIIKLLIRIIGAALLVASGLSILGVTVVFVNLIFNIHSSYIDPLVPRIADISHPAYYITLALAYAAALIILVLLWLVALSWTKWKSLGINTFSATSLGLVFLAIFVAGSALFFKYAPIYAEQIKSLPEYQDSTIQVDAKDFNKIQVLGNANVNLVEAKQYSVIEQGRQFELSHAAIKVENGTLIIGTRNDWQPCLVCFMKGVNVEITAPEISSIAVLGSGNFTAKQLTASNVDVSIGGSGNINLPSLQVKTLNAKISGSGNIHLGGKGDNAIVVISGAGFYDGFAFITKSADISIFGSGLAKAAPTDSLKADITGSGLIAYKGSPAVTEMIRGSGRIEPSTQ